MPELPEVETMRRGVLNVTGGLIRDVESTACRLKPIRLEPKITDFRRRAVGCRILEVGRLGKRVTMTLDSGELLVFEPRMTGLVLLADPPNREHLRLHLSLSECPVRDLWYWDRRGLGNVRLLSPKEVTRQLGPDRLGPDALVVSPEQLRERFKSSRRAIKVAMLDQQALAGVGNLYAAEILHSARIHPEQACNELSPAAWRRLHEAMRAILEKAIRYEGSTLSDGTYRNALNDPGGYQNHHQVYARAGSTCPQCKVGVVRRIVQAQRATFFCPRCQPKRRPRRSRA